MNGRSSALEAGVIPAGFWRRWVARFLDQLALLLIFAALLVLIDLLVVRGAYLRTGTLHTVELLRKLGYLLLAALYFATTESSARQASPGKRMLGIKVVDLDGARLRFPHALARWLAAGLSWLSFGAGFIAAAMPGKRALHDFASHTQVVDRWAYTSTPERQRSTSLGQTAAGFASLAFVFMVFLAYTQYSDYVVRSQISEGMSLSDSIKTDMGIYVQGHGSWPSSNAQLGLGIPSGSYVSSIDVGSRPGRIDIAFSAKPPQHVERTLDGRHLYIDGVLEDGRIRWTCHSPQLRQEHCPASCACSW